jgi:signal transduction histidine kinase
VKFTERGRVRIEASVRDGRLHAIVIDSGIGIRPEQLKLLFEAFRQLDGSPRRLYEGTGLGLHLCRKLLDLMGGNIEVQSEFGTGSRFSFSVPLDLSAAAAAATQAAAVH